MPAWSCTCMCVHVSACLCMCMLVCACVCRAVPVCVHVVLGPKSTLLHIKLAPQLGQLWPWQQQWQHPQHLYDPLHAAAAALASGAAGAAAPPATSQLATHTQAHTDTHTLRLTQREPRAAASASAFATCSAQSTTTKAASTCPVCPLFLPQQPLTPKIFKCATTTTTAHLHAARRIEPSEERRLIV